MKILVISGSPGGENSVTWQTVRYLAKLHPEHRFDTIHAGKTIRALEKDFSPVAEAAAAADVILFCYPVYTFIAPCQLHRFVELMKEHQMPVAGKWMTQITTSKHFYDVTAHQWLQENCADMGMKVVRGFSADMDDLLTEKGQKEAEAFWQRFVWSVENGYAERVMRLPAGACATPDPLPDTPGKTGDVVIVTDVGEDNPRLQAMIDRFRAALPRASRVVNLREFAFKGGCLGCFRCAAKGQCIYKDGFQELLQDTVLKAQATVYAFTIRDHAMGSRFKTFDDRRFCDGHRAVTMGMPVGYLVDGAYASEPNLQTLLEARIQVGSNLMAGVAAADGDVNAEIDRLAANVDYLIAHPHSQPQNFYGVGGMKIFRDLVYEMQGMMKADYKFYKAHGMMDFPQKKPGRVLFSHLAGFLNSEKVRKVIGNKFDEGMMQPYNQLIDQ